MTDTFPDYLKLHTGDAVLQASYDPILAPTARPTSKNAHRKLLGLLSNGVAALQCQGAALFALNADTTELKLQASFGLEESPEEILLESTRPLAGAIADLEALTGHVVALESSKLFAYWHAPCKGFGAALCVPVASPSMPLGTLWFFSRDEKVFSEDDTARAELFAHRLALELEQTLGLQGELASRSGIASPAKPDRAHRAQFMFENAAWRHLTATTPPLIEGYKVAGCAQGGSQGAALRDWFSGKGDCIKFMTCYVEGGLQPSMNDAIAYDASCNSAQLLAAGLHAVMYSHLRRTDPEAAIRRGSEYFSRSQAGDRRASICLMELEPKLGILRWVAAGDFAVVRVRDGKISALSKKQHSLGTRKPDWLLEEALVEPGDRLWCVSRSLLQAAGKSKLIKLAKMQRISAEGELERLRAICESRDTNPLADAVPMAKTRGLTGILLQRI